MAEAAYTAVSDGMPPCFPVSGIPRGWRAPYKNRGKYHHRRDLLYTPRWGQRCKQSVLQGRYPTRSGLVWQEDVPQAWPITDNYRAHDLYKLNETRYLIPAMKAQDGRFKTYVLDQLDSMNTSGIGLHNVRWAPAKNGPLPVFKDGDVADGCPSYELPPEIPAHLAGAVESRFAGIFRFVSQHTVARQKIRILDRVIQKSLLYAQREKMASKRLNPFPTVRESEVLLQTLRPAHILTINRRYRAPDLRSPGWRRRSFTRRSGTRRFLMRKYSLLTEQKRTAVRRATQATFTINNNNAAALQSRG